MLASGVNDFSTGDLPLSTPITISFVFFVTQEIESYGEHVHQGHQRDRYT